MTMRIHLVLVAALAFLPGGCASRKASHVEVVAKMRWHHHDYAGRIGSPDYHSITNYYSTNCYAPFVIAQGAGTTLDFALHDSFISPDTGRSEKYFDGLVARIKVSVSNDVAFVSGRLDYDTHFGTVKSYVEDEEAMHAQQLQHLSTRLQAETSLAHELWIDVGEDDDDGPWLCLCLRRSTRPLSRFDPQTICDSL
jgi:hypothetical protein